MAVARRQRRQRRRRCAFTLLEVLLALVVAGILLTYAAFAIVSLSTIWAHRADEDFFIEHVDGVAHFLDVSFQRATGAPRPVFQESAANQEGEETQEEETQEQDEYNQRPAQNAPVSPSGVNLAYPPGLATYRAPLIHFSQLEAPPALSEVGPAGTPGVEAYLQFDDHHGLALLWYAPMLLTEDQLEERDVRSTLVSPYVTKIDYIYRDEETDRWEDEDELRRDGRDYALPEFIRLTFTHDEQEATRIVRIPPSKVDIPRF